MNERVNTNDKLAFVVMAIVVALLCAFYGTFIGSNGYVSSGDVAYVTEGNIFRACFKEPFERIVFVMKDGNSITYTTHDEYCIAVNYGQIKDSLKKKGYEISDIIYCIHNHLRKPFFSTADMNVCRHMRNDGFAGIFALYYQPSGRVIIHEEN